MLNENDEKLILKLPFGFRDIFPTEAKERKNIEEVIREEFESWGYGEVKTPIVEFTENISSGVGKNWKEKLISFFDIDGSLISFRADMTIPIARLIGMRIKPNQLPARFYYIANSFRQSPIQKGQKRVLNQAGLELIGIDEMIADIEVLTLLVRILKKLDIKDFKIALSHSRFLDGISQWFELDNKGLDFIRKKMVEKNLVEIKNFLDKRDLEKTKIFLEIIEPSENFNKLTYFSEIIKNKLVYRSFKYLIDTYEVLKSLNISDNFIIDLSAASGFEYYSGLYFEAYCPKVSEIIGSGGRYNGLIKKFGLDVAGTGFAVDVDLLHKSVGNVDFIFKNKYKKVALVGNKNEAENLIILAQKLREKKLIVEIFPFQIDNANKSDFLVKSSNIYKHKINVEGFDLLYIADFTNQKIEVINLSDNENENKEVISFNYL